MTTELDITHEELFKILQESYAEVGNGFTRRELQEKLGYGDGKMLRLLRKLIANGDVAPIYVTRENIHGEISTVKGYEFLKPLDIR